MEIETSPVKFNAETRALLDAIRRSSEPTVCYGLTPQEAYGVVSHITEPMLDGAALPPTRIQQYRWYTRNLARVFRERYGYALSFQLDLVVRKWRELGLDVQVMQFILCEVVKQMKELRSTQGHDPEGGDMNGIQSSESRVVSPAGEPRAGPGEGSGHGINGDKWGHNTIFIIPSVSRAGLRLSRLGNPGDAMTSSEKADGSSGLGHGEDKDEGGRMKDEGGTGAGLGHHTDRRHVGSCPAPAAGGSGLTAERDCHALLAMTG